MRGRPFRPEVRALRWSPSRCRRRRGGRSAHAIPFVVVGNAIITILMICMIGAGAVYLLRPADAGSAGPAAGRQDRQHSRSAPASATSPTTLNREGVIDVNPWVFIGGVVALEGELGPQARRIFVPEERRACATSSPPSSKARWCSTPSPFLEGLTSEQIVARLVRQRHLHRQRAASCRAKARCCPRPTFPRGTPRDQVIHRMQQAHKQRAGRDLGRAAIQDVPVRSPEQLVTLASIVEKETGRADERSRVAAVFINRLKQKIKLQSDPTIIYGLVGGKGTLGRPIKRSEITQPSPYNTYVIEGLPPGPTRQSRPRLARGHRQPGPHPRSLFRRRRHRRARLHRDLLTQHQKNVAKLRAMEKQIQNDTVEPAEDAPAAGGRRSPADCRVRRATTPARRQQQRSRPPPAPSLVPQPGPPGRACSTSPPVVQRQLAQTCLRDFADPTFLQNSLKIRVGLDGLANFTCPENFT